MNVNNSAFEVSYNGYHATAQETVAKEFDAKAKKVQETEKTSEEQAQKKREDDVAKDEQMKMLFYSNNASTGNGGSAVGNNIDLFA